jgi:hypothetical protein
MKSKLNVKSQYSIKKVNKVLRVKSDKFVPHTYELYKVSGPNKFVKFFVSKKDATEYVKQFTNTKMNRVDVFKEIKRINDIKLPIKTI